MASFRSWLGAAVCFLAWLLAHRFSVGWAAPSFVALVLAALYLWCIVLRVPQFGRELDEVKAEVMEEPLTTAAPADAALEASPGATTSTDKSCVEASARVVSAAPATPEATAVSEAGAAVGEAGAAVGEAGAAVPIHGEESEISSAPHAVREAEERDQSEHSDAQVNAGLPGSDNTGCDFRQPKDEVQDELQIEEEVEDPAKARELRLEGNESFKAGRIYEAREAYSEALHLSPPAGEAGSEPSKDRAVLHCNRAACLQKLGRWDDSVKDCSEAVQLDPTYVKAYARRSTAYEELKKWHDSLEDLKKAIELDPSLRAQETRRLAMLEKRTQEQFEKDKDEMLSKLKELGNTVLGKFGMSTDNFKMEQDPDTGSYSIKFQS